MSRFCTPGIFPTKVFRYLAIPVDAASPAVKQRSRKTLIGSPDKEGIPSTGLVTVSGTLTGTDVSICTTVFGKTSHAPVWVARAYTGSELPSSPQMPPVWHVY